MHVQLSAGCDTRPIRFLLTFLMLALCAIGMQTPSVAKPARLTLTASPSSPQPITTEITLATSSTGAQAQYQFSAGLNTPDGTEWTVLQDYASSTKCYWTPTTVGHYTVQVSTRDAGSQVLSAELPYTVTPSDGSALGEIISIARYQGAKNAAVSFTFDDGLRGQADIAVPMLNEFGFNSTFFVIAGLTRENQSDPQVPMPEWESWDTASWEEWHAAADDGHEIGNHSWNHPYDLSKLTGAALEEQVLGSADVIQQKIGMRPLTFAFPYNQWNPKLLKYVQQYHVAARTTWWDYSYLQTFEYENQIIDSAIAYGEWVVPMLHGFYSGEWGAVDPAGFRDHLAFVKSREPYLWVSTFSNISRYVTERANTTIQVLSITDYGIRFQLVTNLDTTIYHVPLTVIVKTALGDTTLVDVVPNSGPVFVPFYGPEGTVATAKYRHFKSAAVSYTFDDGYPNHPRIVAPMFSGLGFHATFYMNPGWTPEMTAVPGETPPGWEDWRQVDAAGHEVGNHSMDHLDLTTLAAVDELHYQIIGAADLINQKVGTRPLSFAAPFNRVNSEVERVILSRHLWLRPPSVIEYGGDNFSVSAANALIDSTIAGGGWQLILMHDVDGAGYNSLSSSLLDEHLRYVKSKEGSIWVDNARDIIRYTREQQEALLQVTLNYPGSITFTLTCPTLDPAVYNYPLSLLISTGSVAATQVTVTRGAQTLPVLAVKPGAILLEVVPGPEPVSVTYQ
ncbi:MAG: polysaccharide deacetylase family protein [Armatimonadota bacterium]